MNDNMKLFALIFVIIYIISPIDLVPGPIDDAILLCFELISMKNSSKNSQ